MGRRFDSCQARHIKPLRGWDLGEWVDLPTGRLFCFANGFANHHVSEPRNGSDKEQHPGNQRDAMLVSLLARRYKGQGGLLRRDGGTSFQGVAHLLRHQGGLGGCVTPPRAHRSASRRVTLTTRAISVAGGLLPPCRRPTVLLLKGMASGSLRIPSYTRLDRINIRLGSVRSVHHAKAPHDTSSTLNAHVIDHR